VKLSKLALAALAVVALSSAAYSQTQPIPGAINSGGSPANVQGSAVVVAPAGGGAGRGRVVSEDGGLPIQGVDSVSGLKCTIGVTPTCGAGGGGGGGGTLSATASATPTPVVAGPNKPLNIDLFSSGFVTVTDGAGAPLDWSPYSSSATAGVAPVSSTAAEACHVLKNSPGNLYSISGTIGAAGWIMVFNATSAPGDGAVTPVAWAQPQAAGSWSMSWGAAPAYFSTGIVVCASSTGPFTKTAYSTNTVFSGQVK
jgi:hypothetical protein